MTPMLPTSFWLHWIQKLRSKSYAELNDFTLFEKYRALFLMWKAFFPNQGWPLLSSWDRLAEQEMLQLWNGNTNTFTVNFTQPWLRDKKLFRVYICFKALARQDQMLFWMVTLQQMLTYLNYNYPTVRDRWHWEMWCVKQMSRSNFLYLYLQ